MITHQLLTGLMLCQPLRTSYYRRYRLITKAGFNFHNRHLRYQTQLAATGISHLPKYHSSTILLYQSTLQRLSLHRLLTLKDIPLIPQDRSLPVVSANCRQRSTSLYPADVFPTKEWILNKGDLHRLLCRGNQNPLNLYRRQQLKKKIPMLHQRTRSFKRSYHF